MMISFVLQAFVLSFLSQAQHESQRTSTIPQVAAASSPSMQQVSGYDARTDRTFSHALPVVGENNFGPRRIDDESLGIITTADSVMILDRKTSNVLYDEASDQQRPIASLTKLMTALVLLDRGIDFSDTVTIQSSDMKEGGRIWVYPGEQILVQDLWMAGLIASDNVAITALVRHTGLSQEEFAQAMNQKAIHLGLSQTSFSEPTGISRWNVSTASELAIIVNEALGAKQIQDAVRRPSYAFAPLNKETVRTIESTNALLTSYINEEPYRLIGGKTGFTYEAGYCLAVIADGPMANDEIIVIVLGADTMQARFQEVKSLVDWTYTHFAW